MANKYIKRCSTSLVIRGMQIKATMSCHLILTRTAMLKKTITSVGNNVRNWNLHIGTLINCYGNVKWCSGFGKQFGSSSKVTYRVTI